MNQSITARYWKIVRSCLVEFHGYSNHGAEVRVREFRAALAELKRVSDDPYASEMIYHDEAFNVANDLAGRRVESFTDEWPR